MARPPNYKQDKKRREDAQKKRNAEEQQRKARRNDSPERAPGAQPDPNPKPAGS
ncbi:MAG: hypothetical protein WDO56_29125 [Gammaproteobacteria bacterium]